MLDGPNAGGSVVPAVTYGEGLFATVIVRGSGPPELHEFRVVALPDDGPGWARWVRKLRNLDHEELVEPCENDAVEDAD